MTNEEFEAKRYHYKARFTGLYDGDSIDCEIDQGFGNNRTFKKATGRVRLLYINAPEITGGTLESKALAIISRDALAQKIVGREGYMKTYLDRREGFGRYLAEIWIDGECINTWMMENGYAVPYED